MKKLIPLIFSATIVLYVSEIFSQWSQLSSYPSSSSKGIVISNGVFYSCSANGGVYSSSDNGTTWQERNNNLITADSKRVYGIELLSGKLYIATVDGIYISTNNGESWERKSAGLTIGPGANNVFAFSIFESDGIFFTGTYNGIYRSTNAGDNWSLTNISGQGIEVVSFIKFNNELYAGRDAINFPAMYKSIDGGNNWINLNVWNNFPLSGFCYFSEGDTLFSGTGHGMWVTTNNGVNWFSRNNGLNPDPYVSSIVKVGNTMIASLKFGGSGMFKSSNNGIDWIDIRDNLPFLNEISKLTIYGNYVYASTGNKIWKRSLQEIVTGAGEVFIHIPQDYFLKQNYPNPFNPVTNLEVGISYMPDGLKSAFISLKIYDVRGNEIAALVNENKIPGIYNIKFDAGSYPSGIYYYTLFANGNKIDTKKMILLK